MAIPFYDQYYVEGNRSNLYQWLNYLIILLSLGLYGLFLHWIPIFLRSQRDQNSIKYKPYFKFLRLWETLNQVVLINVYFTTVYIQPSLLVLYGMIIMINGWFSVVHTKDLDYQPQSYIVAKRLSKVAIGNLPIIYLCAIKNDLVTSITGLQHDRIILLHRWLARLMFAMICIHIGLAADYWLLIGFPIMLVIPPQIFGYIAFASFFLLSWGSIRFIRRLAYDFFLVEHRVLSFIMLLFMFFHSMKGTKAAVILAVHQLVIDRILSRILSFVHTRMSPTKGKSRFEVLDDDTLLVTVPIKAFPFASKRWFAVFLPNLNTWKPGQHVYLTVGKVSFFQQHPFTISSLSESGEMKFVIRVQRGFTKKLMKKVKVLKEKEIELQDLLNSSGSSGDSSVSSSALSIEVETELLRANRPQARRLDDDNDLETNSDDVVLKATFVGPVGALYQPLITFDATVFFSAGSGASFTLPVCADLLHTIESKNMVQDYFNRSPNPIVKIVWTIRKLSNFWWYKFIMEELITYVDKGMVKIDVYVTQESVEKANEAQEGIFSKVNFMNGRPDISKVIGNQVNELCDKIDYKSIAVLSCGPNNFTHSIKKECQKYRWKNDGPDIYCYTESFD